MKVFGRKRGKGKRKFQKILHIPQKKDKRERGKKKKGEKETFIRQTHPSFLFLFNNGGKKKEGEKGGEALPQK